jgi:hypothetical protein
MLLQASQIVSLGLGELQFPAGSPWVDLDGYINRLTYQ